MSHETTPYIVDFSEIRETQRGAVGGKAYSLAELCAGGFPVPEGFALTTRALDELLAARALATQADLLADGARAEVPAEALAAARERVCKMALPETVRSAASGDLPGTDRPNHNAR